MSGAGFPLPLGTRLSSPKTRCEVGKRLKREGRWDDLRM